METEKRLSAFCLVLFLVSCTIRPVGSAEPFVVQWSTFLGGKETEQARDVAVDTHGAIHIVGGTGSSDFPRTIGSPHQGSYDVFVTRISPQGKVVWSRLLGGPGYDRAYAVEVDQQGNVYVGGRAGPGYPTTANVLQPDFGGDSTPNDLYGPQDGFVTKLSPDGAIVWSTFFGGNDPGFFRDIDIDPQGTVYGALTGVSVDDPNQHISSGAFLATIHNHRVGVLARIRSDGQRVIWATYIGMPLPNTKLHNTSSFETPTVRYHSSGFVYATGGTNNPNMPTGSGTFATLHGPSDEHVVKFSDDGVFEWGAYVGGSDVEYADTHNLAVDKAGNVIVAATTKSPDLCAGTPGGFQTAYGGSGGNFNQVGDGFLKKISADGKHFVACTYLGGNSGEGLEGVALDGQDNVYVSGGTHSKDFPLTDALPPNRGSASDLFAAKFSADFSSLLFSKAFGGSISSGIKTPWYMCERGRDLGLAIAVFSEHLFYVVGESCAPDFPTVDPIDPTLDGAKDTIFIAYGKPSNAADAPPALSDSDLDDNGIPPVDDIGPDAEDSGVDPGDL